MGVRIRLDGIVAGEAIAIGDPVYVSPTDGKWYKARADTAGKEATSVAGAAAALGAVVEVVALGDLTGLTFAAPDQGKTVFLGATGGLAVAIPAAGTIQRLGQVASTTMMMVNVWNRPIGR